METLIIPAAVLSFLLRFGCTPVGPVYVVDEAWIDFKVEDELTKEVSIKPIPLNGIFVYGRDDGCESVRIIDKGVENNCPQGPATYIRRSKKDRTDLLVHELAHSCQEPTRFGTRENMLDEWKAQKLQRMWRGE